MASSVDPSCQRVCRSLRPTLASPLRPAPVTGARPGNERADSMLTAPTAPSSPQGFSDDHETCKALGPLHDLRRFLNHHIHHHDSHSNKKPKDHSAHPHQPSNLSSAVMSPASSQMSSESGANGSSAAPSPHYGAATPAMQRRGESFGGMGVSHGPSGAATGTATPAPQESHTPRDGKDHHGAHTSHLMGFMRHHHRDSDGERSHSSLASFFGHHGDKKKDKKDKKDKYTPSASVASSAAPSRTSTLIHHDESHGGSPSHTPGQTTPAATPGIATPKNAAEYPGVPHAVVALTHPSCTRRRTPTCLRSTASGAKCSVPARRYCPPHQGRGQAWRHNLRRQGVQTTSQRREREGVPRKVTAEFLRRRHPPPHQRHRDRRHCQ